MTTRKRKTRPKRAVPKGVYVVMSSVTGYYGENEIIGAFTTKTAAKAAMAAEEKGYSRRERDGIWFRVAYVPLNSKGRLVLQWSSDSPMGVGGRPHNFGTVFSQYYDKGTWKRDDEDYDAWFKRYWG